MERNSFWKRVVVLVISVSFVVFAILPMVNAQYLKENEKNINLEEYVTTSFASPNHHKVLAEVGTATWCQHCPSMAYYIAQVQGDFQYISLVTDKNSYADQRSNELGITGYPTAFFDGGYTQVFGHQYNVNNLQNAYGQCQARTVADVDISLSAIWHEKDKNDPDDDTMDVIAFVDNHESADYSGRLRVYVTEITSRWDDYDGIPYKYAMLGYAFNKEITVPTGCCGKKGTWIGRVENWRYPDMTMDNILVVGAVFDQSTDYVDETTTTKPKTPTGPLPVVTITYPYENEILNDTVTITGTAHYFLGDGKLKWVMVQIDDGEWTKADGIVSWSLDWDTTTVEDGYHLIKAITSTGSVQSAVRYLQVITNNHGNFPPEKPETPTGPVSGEAGYPYTYTTSTTDLNRDDVRFGWDWDGDNIVDEWTDYILQGEPMETSHTWVEAGTYHVKIKAEDTEGDQSDFSDELVVVITGVNNPPTVKITKPETGVYIDNVKKISFPITIIVGSINIKVDATDDYGINRVEFYIDDELKAEDDDTNDDIYTWTWDEFSFGGHTLKVIAYDNDGKSATDEMTVWKFF